MFIAPILTVLVLIGYKADDNTITVKSTTKWITKPKHGEIYNNSDNNSQFPLKSNVNRSTLNPSNFWKMCTTIATCKGNCRHVLGPGKKLSKKIFRPCNCDHLCEYFHDCCADYKEECTGMVSSDSIITIFAKKPSKMMTTTLTTWAKAINTIMAFNPRKNYNFGCINTPGHIDEYVLMVNKCPVRWNHARVRQLCEEATIRNLFTVVPVYGNDKVLYRNQYCAKCHKITNITFWAIKAECQNVTQVFINNLFNDEYPDLLRLKKQCEIIYQLPKGDFSTRECLSMVSECPSKLDENLHKNIKSLCKTYNAPVVATNESKSFKNIFCAICHGFNEHQLTCPYWIKNERNSIWNAYVDQQIILDISFPSRSKWLSNRFLAPLLSSEIKIPAPLSIIMNFGSDGSNHLIFQPQDNECPTNEIYDPFINQCRKVFCSPGYKFVEGNCIKSNNSSNEFGEEINNINNTIYISLVVRLKEEMERFEQTLENMKLDVITTLTKMFHIDPARINNISFGLVDKDSLLGEDNEEKNVYHKPSNKTKPKDADEDETFFRISFTLSEVLGNRTQPSIAKVMSQMSSFVSLKSDTFAFEFTEYPELVETIDGKTIVNSFDIDKWCKKNFRKKYLSNDFTLLMRPESDDTPNDWTTQVYINKTRILYKKGEFIANLLYIKFKDGFTIHGNVIVCQMLGKLTKSCPRILFNSSEYYVLPNQSIIHKFSHKLYNLNQYEMSKNGLVLVCVDYFTLMFAFDVTQAFISTVLFIISFIAMLLTLITYTTFRELRNLPGLNLVNLVVSLMIAQILFLIGTSRVLGAHLCKITAILVHYAYLVTFFWMNVLSFDLFCTFGLKTAFNQIRSTKDYLGWYALYAYGVPAIIVGVCVFIDLCHCINNLEIGYGKNEIAWIQSSLANLLAFGIPLAVILIVNIVFFLKTVLAIRSLKKNIKKSMEYCKSSPDNLGQSDVKLYMRISSVMGFTWIFGFASGNVNPQELPYMWQVLTYCFIIFNTLQGLFIFCAFILNKRVLKLYKNLCHKLKQKLGHECRNSLCNKSSYYIKNNLSQMTLVSDSSNGLSESEATPKISKRLQIIQYSGEQEKK